MESVEKKDFYKRREQAKYELDEQLEFYDKYISKSAVRIYMSDHGAEWEPSARCHVMLNIYEEGRKAESIKEMFSLIDFSLIMKAVLNKEEIYKEKSYRKYVDIQDFPWYRSSYPT